MEDLDEYFSYTGPKKPIKLRTSQTKGKLVITDELMYAYSPKPLSDTASCSSFGTDYAREYREKEKQRYQEYLQLKELEESKDGMECLEDLTSMGDSAQLADITEGVLTQIYKNYSFKRHLDVNLAINDSKVKILGSISSLPVTIVEGPTGCGKTTQVPQWILDECYERKKHCNIVVTQPRRIAAISIAKRVAQERGWDLGGLVGYQVGLENKTSMDTRISYVTTGVLLQKLISAQTLNAYTHIILDEIHERGKDMDFLLLVVKKLLFTNSRGVKVVLMSATFNIHQFSQYFEIPISSGKYEKASVISVKKKNRYLVKEFYLNHLAKLGSLPIIKEEEPGITKEGYDIVIRLLNAFERIDANEMEKADLDVKPSVLIFLPGILEIEALYNNLTDLKYRAEVEKASVQHKWWVVPLHSTITGDEQAKVFQKAPPAHRKIILSTNIAESSITVPDIKYVVDFCLMKVLVADPQTNFTSLQLDWASKTNCKQRSGRAGRARDGRIYRLVPDHFYEMLPEECVPEMKRSPLEQLVLLAKMLNMGPPKQILALSMDPPDLYNIQRTILVLKETGGLLKTLCGEVSDEDGDITYLGRIMAKLPVDVRISKLIVLGYLFGCLEECIIMGAAMSAKNVFSTPFQKRLDAYNSKLTWADGCTSDCISFLNVYKVWRRQKELANSSRKPEKVFAQELFLQLKPLYEMGELVVELRHRLAREGIEHAPGQSVAGWSREELSFILKILIAGAFYPHYFVQKKGGDDYQREAVKILGGLDPCNTVYLTSPALTQQPGRLYACSLKNVFRKYIKEDMTVTFDKTGCKAYITFGADTDADVVKTKDSLSPNIPGKVSVAVYKAIKINQLRIPISINILPEDKANEAALLLPGALDQEMLEQCLPRLPDIEDTFIDVHISHYIDCGHFWAQYVDSSLEQLKHMEKQMNSAPLLALTQDPEVGDVLAAPFQEAEGGPLVYCRARVHCIIHSDRKVLIHYIDYGNYAKVSAGCLKMLTGWMLAIRPLAMECVLAQVAPAVHNNPRAVWSADANMLFQRLTSGKRLLGKVYAVAYGIVYLDLMVNGQVSIVEALVAKKLARKVDEGYQCRLNHEQRESAQELQNSQKRAINLQQLEQAHKIRREPPPPDPRDCSQLMYFKGPFSPLESSVRSMMHVSRDKPVTIEWNSVNSVLLDTDPQDCYDRLMVAAAVTQNGERLSLRHTTLLPNVPGLPAFVAMMFCPSMELRRDPTNSRYVSALCGLGHRDGRALYPEHDMLVDIDVQIDIKDLESINYLRYLMNTMLTLQDGQDQPNVSDKFKEQVPSKIRENILHLTTTPRLHVDAVSVRSAWSWGALPPGDVQLPDTCFDQQRAVFPLHDALQLYPMPAQHAARLLQENDKLNKLVKGLSCPTSAVRDLDCPLCESACLPLPAMRIHLASQRHTDMEAYLARQLGQNPNKELH